MEFDNLCKILFEGKDKVVDIQLIPGTDKVDRETLSKALRESMERMNLIKDKVINHAKI